MVPCGRSLAELYIAKYGTADGHGGNGYRHRKEMEQIAQSIFREELRRALPEIRQYIMDRLPDNSEIQKQAYEQGFRDAVNTVQEQIGFDVNSAVKIGFDNGAQIFFDKKTQKVVADHLMKDIEKQLKKMK